MQNEANKYLYFNTGLLAERQVKAAAVNPADILFRDPGWPNMTSNIVPGMDAAGVVESVGPGVSRLHPGQKVIAAVNPVRPEGGAQAQHIVVPAASVVLRSQPGYRLSRGAVREASSADSTIRPSLLLGGSWFPSCLSSVSPWPACSRPAWRRFWSNAH